MLDLLSLVPVCPSYLMRISLLLPFLSLSVPNVHIKDPSHSLYPVLSFFNAYLLLLAHLFKIKVLFGVEHLDVSESFSC